VTARFRGVQFMISLILLLEYDSTGSMKGNGKALQVNTRDIRPKEARNNIDKRAKEMREI
jgi:hypothetical protein